MSVLESNFNQAVKAMVDLVEKEEKEATLKSGNVIVQVAYNEDSFELCSAALNPSKDEKIPEKMANDAYYNMVFVVRGLDDVIPKFRDKYLFKLAYADIHFALFCAYRKALMSEKGEHTLTTSFYKPNIDDSAWAYKEVFKYTNLGHFRCWMNFDDEYKNVDIQADNDMITQYHDLLKQE